MRTGLIVEKVGMTSVFSKVGERIAVTILKLQDCQVVGQKTLEKNGYNALLIGAKNKRVDKVIKPLRQMFVNANAKVIEANAKLEKDDCGMKLKEIQPKAKLREFRVSNNCFLDIGFALEVDHFKIGQFVDVTGVTIGRGFAGSMKRHNFKGLEASHGVSISHRSHGSTGGRQDPGKVFKNKKMAGHMGVVRVTVQNLKVINTNKEEGIIMVSGNVPGSEGSYIYIRDAIKKNFVVLG